MRHFGADEHHAQRTGLHELPQSQQHIFDDWLEFRSTQQRIMYLRLLLNALPLADLRSHRLFEAHIDWRQFGKQRQRTQLWPLQRSHGL